MNKVRLLAIDLDGTTLNSNGKLSDINKKALLKALENGIEVVVTTGRGMNYIPKQIEQLPIRYYISKNGAVIIDKKENIELYHKYFDKDKILKVVKLLESTKGILNVEDKDYHYINKRYLDQRPSFYIEHQYSNVILTDNIYETIKNLDLKVDKINYCAIDQETYDEIYSNKFAIEGMDMAQTYTLFIDINQSDCSKGEGLARLCNILNISANQVAAIGDNDNDVSMLKFANYSFAVENATQLLKENTIFIVKSNDENGLAQAIDIMLND